MTIVATDMITRRRMLRGLGMAAGAGALAGCGSPLAISGLEPPIAPALRVASFNIRYLDLTEQGQASENSVESWEKRRGAVVTALRAIDADIMAFQEMESWDGAPQNGTPIQRSWLSSQMPEYTSASCTCADGRESSQPIFYKRARFTVKDEGTRSLGSVFSAALDQAHLRAGAFAGYSDLVSWARLHDRITGVDLTVINLHLHFINQLRQKGAAQLAVKIAHTAMERGDRVVVLGDMNVSASARPIAVLRAGDLTLIPSEGASFHFNTGFHAYNAIDHILHGPRLVALGNAQIVRGRVEGVWPSDHYPIWADLQPI